MKTRIVTDINECKILWEKFSPKETIFDEWVFRYEFWNNCQQSLNFILVTDDADNECAMIPLTFHNELKKYVWFGELGDGSTWPEDTFFWFDREKFSNKEIMEILPVGTELYNFRKDHIEGINEEYIKEGNPKYVLDISGFDTIEDYLQTLEKKKRYNFRKSVRDFSTQKVEIVKNNMDDLDLMFKYNIERFGEKSILKPVVAQKIIRDLTTKFTEIPETEFVFYSYVVNGVPSGFFYTIYYKDIASPLLTGRADVSELGTYMLYHNIQTGFERKCRLVDFAEGSEHSYKAKYFPKVEQVMLQK